MAVSVAISEIFSVKERPDLKIWVCSGVLQGHWKWRAVRQTMYDFLLLRHCYYIVPFASYLTLNNPVTLKSGLEATQGHWKRCRSKAWVRFSYSPSIATIAVSVAVCEIFSAKEYCDLQNRVRVRSRSLQWHHFDRSHTSSYSPSIVIMALSCIVCEI